MVVTVTGLVIIGVPVYGLKTVMYDGAAEVVTGTGVSITTVPG
jgi:hypothetical protein